ncbi:MAG: GAF domain-containing protein [Anaerolineales bacterium]|nr:GAF domain-containing protein [Anaerolineales bacterium]
MTITTPTSPSHAPASRLTDASQVRLLRTLLIIAIVTDVLVFGASLAGGYGWEYVTPAAFLFVTSVGSLVALARGYSLAARVILPLSLFLAITVSVAFVSSGYGLRDVNIMAYALVVSLASLTLGQSGAFTFAALIVLAIFGIGIAEMRGILVTPTSALTEPITPIVLSVFILAVTFMLRTLMSLFNESVRRAQASEQEVVKRNEELQALSAGLERTVQERTASLQERAAQLQAITELSETVSQVQNPNEIFSVASHLISERFGFYHVGIFLIDRDREFAVLQAANSAGGKKMLERGHRLALGTGVVGFAAQTGKPRIALDVGEDAVFFNNPDLPQTRSEIALPLAYGDRVIGALDAQSAEAGAFSEEDFRALGTLANQLAIAIENARLLSEARAAAVQVQEVYNEFVRTQWAHTGETMNYAGYRYNAGRIELLEARPDGESDLGLGTNNLTANPGRPSETTREKVAILVRLRGEVIGMLNVESNDPKKSWRADELSLMEAVAERAALALENARLFQDARRRAAKERMIAEATSHIGNSMNIENILQATAAELERVLGGSEVLIRFDSKDSA